LEHDGDDLRELPLIKRKRRLAKLIGKAKRRAIRITEHLTGDGPTVFEPTDAPWNVVSAFANCGRAFAHVRGSDGPAGDIASIQLLRQLGQVTSSELLD